MPDAPSLHEGGVGAPPAEIAEFEDGGVGVHQEVLGFDVAVTDALGVDVGQAPKKLVHVDLGTNPPPPPPTAKNQPWGGVLITLKSDGGGFQGRGGGPGAGGFTLT